MEKRNILTIVGLAILMVLVAIFEYFIYTGHFAKKSVQVPDFAHPTLAPGSTDYIPADRTTWKSYTNDQYGFTLKYPPLWEMASTTTDMHTNIWQTGFLLPAVDSSTVLVTMKIHPNQSSLLSFVKSLNVTSQWGDADLNHNPVKEYVSVKNSLKYTVIGFVHDGNGYEFFSTPTNKIDALGLTRRIIQTMTFNR